MRLPAGIVVCRGARAAALCVALREAGFDLVEADGAGAEALVLDGALPEAARLCAASPLPVIEVIEGTPHEGADAYLTTSAGGPVAVAAVNAVIQRRRAARRMEQLLGGILEHAPAAIYSCAADGRYTLVNRAWEAFTGRRRGETVGRAFEEVWPAELARTFHEGARRVLEAHGPITEEQMVQIDATRRVFQTVKFPVSGGMAGISFDITQRKQAGEALRDREEHLRIALDSASMGAWSYAPATREFEASPQASALHGLPAGEPVTVEAVLSACHPEDRDRLLAEMRGLTGEGDQFKIEYRTVGPGGEVRWMAAQGRLVAGRIFGVVQDVTDRRRIEEQLLEKHKVEAVGRLAAGLAHRLNNSLTEVLGNIGFALEALDQRDPAREPLEAAAEACASMAGLTRDLLAYAGGSASFMRPLDLAALVAALPLAQLVTPPVRLEFEFERGVPLVEGDADQLARLATHVVKNAAESMASGAPGTISVAVAACDFAARDLEGFHGREHLQAGRYVCLRVTDSGCGMDAAALGLIFDPFFSTKFVGRGLGLASVLGAARNHRGGIRVESAPGRGTSVTVCIPAKA